MNINEFKQKADRTHYLIYSRKLCNCNIIQLNKGKEISPTSNIITRAGKVKANEYLLGCSYCHKEKPEKIRKNTVEKLAAIIHPTYLFNEPCSKGHQVTIHTTKSFLLSYIPCDTCNKERLKERYIKQATNSNNGNTNLYIVKFKSKHSSEEFYKLGLTFTNISDRFKDWSKYYTIETLLFKEGDVEKTYNLEQSLHTALSTRNLSYTPYFTNNLGGSSECFVATEEFITKLTEYTNNKLTGYTK